MNRRALLQLLSVAGVAPATTLNTARGALVSAATATLRLDNEVAGPSPFVSGSRPPSWAVFDLIDDAIQELRYHSPVDIDTKKSWSPAFKDVLRKRELRQLRELQRSMRMDDAVVDTVLDLLSKR